MTSIPLINQGSSYYAGTGIQDEINQLAEVAAISPLTQTTRSITRWETSDVGPGTDHNLLKDTPGVILSDAGDVNAFNSILFNSNASIPVAGALWKKTSDGHLYFGAVDLQASAAANVTSTSGPVTGDSLVRYDGSSGNFVEVSSIVSGSVNTQFYGASGPVISAEGVSYPNFVAPSLSNILKYYISQNVILSYTGPYLVSPSTLTLFCERIGNVVTVQMVSGIVAASADAVAPAAIVTTTGIPAFARPVANTAYGVLGVIADNVFQTGSWHITPSGILTINPTVDPTSLFASPAAGVTGVVGLPSFTYNMGM